MTGLPDVSLALNHLAPSVKVATCASPSCIMYFRHGFLRLRQSALHAVAKDCHGCHDNKNNSIGYLLTVTKVKDACMPPTFCDVPLV